MIDCPALAGRLVELVPDSALDVPLHRQTPRPLDGPIDRPSDAVRHAAADALPPA